MKKLLICLMGIICALVLSGCGRSSEFGVVDMAKVETEAKQLVDIREEATKELEKLEKELKQEIKGKSEEQREEILKEYQARAQIVQSNMTNRLRNQLDGVIHQIAQQKGLGAVLLKQAVPDGGTDITAEILEKLK